MGLINYLGESKIIKRICELLNVTDVQDGEGHSLVDENGIAIVTGGGGGASALDDLSDVNITSAADYQTLIYDSTDQEWQNGSLAFTNLSDVNISSPSNNQVLKYDSTAGEWQNKNASWLPLSGGTVTGDVIVRKSNPSSGATTNLGVGGKNTNDTYGSEGLLTLRNDTGAALIVHPPAGSFSWHDVYFQKKGGTIALTSDIPSDFVPASTGGTFEGDVTIDKADGTTSVVGQSKIVLGNSTLSSADENSKGVVRLYSRGSKYVDICAPDGSAINDNYELNVPDKSGTIAVTSDIPAAVAVKGDNEQDYRTGNVNLTAENIGSVRSRAGVVISTLDDLVELLTQSGGGRCFIAVCNLSNIGVGVTGWQRVIGVSQNGANNGSYNLGLFCLFMPSNGSTNIKYALIDGKTTGNYSVTATGSIPYSSDLTNGTVTSVATGTGLQGGTITSSGTIETYLPRVKKSCNVFPGANKIIWEEYQSGTSYNLPSNAYYHIISMQGSDTNYGTQLALGMTTSGAYYRNYNAGTWGNWQSIINTNTVTGVRGSAESSYKTGNVDISAANVGALPISGGTLTGQLSVIRSNSGTSSVDSVILAGNSTPSGTAGCTRGYVRLYGANAYGANILPPDNNTALRNYTLPQVSSHVTLAHTGSDITGSAASLKSGSLTYCSLGTLTANNGNVTLDTKTSAKWALVQQADGNLVVYQNSTARWSSGTSSRRFKHNIQDMTEERARKILDIRPVTFDWNDDQPYTTGQNDNAGVIAEEVSKICPDLVVFEELEDGSQVERRVEYERFTPYLIKMVQMQQREIDELKKEIQSLKKD